MPSGLTITLFATGTRIILAQRVDQRQLGFVELDRSA